MVCIICIAAAATVGAAVLGPDAMKDIFQKLKGAVPDARQTAESASVARWEGTYEFKRSGNAPTPIPIAIYVYKGQKRLRIQLRTHALDPNESEHVQDVLAAAMGVTIVARNIPEGAGEHGTDHLVKPESAWIGEPIPASDGELRDQAS